MASGHNSKETVDLYHYTSKANATKIEKGQVIKQSTGPGDIAYGEGAYFTALPPSAGKDYIKQNNWDDNSKAISDRKVQATIKVTIPSDEVQKHTTPSGREIFTKQGNVDLSKYPHEAFTNKWQNE